MHSRLSFFKETAIKFLTEPTATKSIRESHYQHSPYIAEYFSTLSNVGLFAVGFYYKDYTTLAAATFSALSHAIPSQRLHDLDFAGIYFILAKVALNYDVLLNKPDVIAYGALALSFNLLDTYISRNYLDSAGPTTHVLWHFAAAFALYKFNEAQATLTPSIPGLSK